MSDDQAREFLAALMSGLGEGEWIEIRPIGPGGVAGRRWFSSITRAADYVARLAPTHDVYVGVCPRRQGGGTRADVTSVRAIWADADDKCRDGDDTLMLESLCTLPLPPSMIVRSGHGYHAYWLLDTPLSITGPAEIARVEGLMRRLHVRLGDLDLVHDLGRILRLPGTANHKEQPPLAVTLVACDATRRYSLNVLEGWLPPVPPPIPPRPTPLAAAVRSIQPPWPDMPTIEEVRAMLACLPVHGNYKTYWLTILMAVHDAFPGPDGVALCEAWSPGHPGEIAEKFASFGRRGTGTIKIATLAYQARLHGYCGAPPRYPRSRRRVIRLCPKGGDHGRVV